MATRQIKLFSIERIGESIRFHQYDTDRDTRRDTLRLDLLDWELDTLIHQLQRIAKIRADKLTEQWQHMKKLAGE